MRVVSIANFKGGTGKTVTACNMAAELAAMGKKVLLIDADPQHNTSDFYLPKDAGEVQTLYDLLEGIADPHWENIVEPTGREGIDLLPADMQLLLLDLGSIVNGSQAPLTARFADFLDALRTDDAFDYVIIDCPPSFTAATVAALLESDDVIMPTRVDAFSRQGVTELIDQVRNIGRAARGLKFHALITMHDRTNLSRQGEALLRQSGFHVFRTVIRACVAVGESTYAKQPLREYAPRCTAAKDYEFFAREFREEVRLNG